MQQATEITRVAPNLNRQVFESAWVLLRCGMLVAVITGVAGCTGNDRNIGDGDSSRIEHDKSNATRILRRGLPGEPRTLDPQLAEDTFSFPVLRDLTGGLRQKTVKDKSCPAGRDFGK